MIKYKSGDLWKVIGLVILIAGTFFISFRFILTSGVRPSGPARSSLKQAGPTTTATAPGSQMFAQRAHPPAELLTRARTAPDPFRPYVTAANAVPEEPRPAPAPASTPRPAGSLPPLRLPSMDELRLVGVVTGTYPLAVISGEGTRYFVRVGEALPSGWRVAGLDRNSATLSKGGDRMTLKLSDNKPVVRPPG